MATLPILASKPKQIERRMLSTERVALFAVRTIPQAWADAVAEGVVSYGLSPNVILPAQERLRRALEEQASTGLQAGYHYAGEQIIGYLEGLLADLPPGPGAQFAANPTQYRLPLDPEDLKGIIAEHEDITVRPVRGLEWYKQRALELARVTSADLLREAEKRVTDAIREGQGLREIQAGLRKTFPDFTRARLENIARTESSHLFNAGRWSFYQESGAVWGYRFRAIQDDRTTQVCSSLDGSTFAKGEEAGRVPPCHFACRSTLDPVLWTEAGQPGFAWKVNDDAQPAMKGFGGVPQ